MSGPVTDRPRFAIWLAQQLTERSWRQVDMVTASGGTIQRDRVSKWLAGKEVPSFASLQKIAAALGVPEPEVFEATGLRSPGPRIDQAVLDDARTVLERHGDPRATPGDLGSVAQLTLALRALLAPYGPTSTT